MKKKEIEEILNELKDVAERHTIEIREYGVVETIPQSISKELRLNSYSANLLLSYIEQLENEIEEYQKELEKADSITQSCIFNGKKDSEISYRKCLNMLERLKKEKKQLETNYKEANESITWWTNRYNAIVKQNDDNHKKVVKLENNRDKAIEYFKFENPEIFKNPKYTHHLWTIDGLTIKRFIDILKGDSE